MTNVTKNRWQVRVAAMIIFVLGFTAGILALNVYRGWHRGGGPGNRMDELSERLQLTADQKTKVQEIFNDTVIGFNKFDKEVVRITVEEPTFERSKEHLNSIYEWDL